MAKQKISTVTERDGFQIGDKLYAFLPNVKSFIGTSGIEISVEDALKDEELLAFLVQNKSCLIESLGEVD